MNRHYFFGSLCALVGLASSAAAQVGGALEVVTLINPSPVPGAGQVHLLYELHLTNWTTTSQLLRQVQTRDPDSGASLLTYEGEELIQNTVIVGTDRANEQVVDSSGELSVEIPAGRRALVYLWISVPPDRVPSSLAHRITYEQSSPDGGAEEIDLETPEIGLGPPPVVISPPLRGENWLVTTFGRQRRSQHSRYVSTPEGRAVVATRFAVDWGRFVGGPGITVSEGFRFPGRDGNAGSRSWGEEVLAVAEGVVEAVTDGFPDNNGPERAVPVTPETVGGNSVLLDIGGDRFAWYAHLQQGSIRVSVGDTVQVGQVLGLIGNSGNSGAPHLHFQITLGGFDGEGVPYLLDRFDLIGRPTGVWDPETFFEWFPPRPVEQEMPMPNHVVSFSRN